MAFWFLNLTSAPAQNPSFEKSPKLGSPPDDVWCSPPPLIDSTIMTVSDWMQRSSAHLSCGHAKAGNGYCADSRGLVGRQLHFSKPCCRGVFDNYPSSTTAPSHSFLGCLICLICACPCLMARSLWILLGIIFQPAPIHRDLGRSWINALVDGWIMPPPIFPYQKRPPMRLNNLSRIAALP